MRISDMQKYLAAVKRKHGDIELIENRYSDYQDMGPVPRSTDIADDPHRYVPSADGKGSEPEEPSNWALVQAAPMQDGAYLMRDHHSLNLHPERRAALNFKTYLLYKGN